MKIYVVFGCCGEYSDHIRWPVKAFRTEKKAQDFALEAKKQVDAFYNKAEEEYKAKKEKDFFDELSESMQLKHYPQIFDEPRPKTECDPSPYFDYTGTDYDYESVELEDQ